MKQQKRKTIFAWLLATALLVTSFLSPLAAMANNSSPQYNNIYEAARIRYLTKAADACLKEAQNSAIVPLTATNEENLRLRTGLMNLYNLNLTFRGFNNFQEIILYDSYLESLGQGGYENGSVYCRELNDAIHIVKTLFDTLGADAAENIVCGSDNGDGLFRIKMGYLYYDGSDGHRSFSGNQEDRKSENWPNGWPSVDENNYVIAQNCRDAFDKIKYYTDTNQAALVGRPQGRENKPFGVQFVINKDFNFKSFLEEYLNRYTASEEELPVANKYLNLVNACGVSDVTSGDYEQAKRNGAAGYYKIYNGLTTRYVTIDSPGRQVQVNEPSWNKALNEDPQSFTCKQLAEDLSPDKNADLIREQRLRQINACYDTAQQNITNLKTAKGNLESIKNFAIALQQAAEGVYESKSYGGGFVSDEELHWTKAMDASAKKISGNSATPTSVQGFIDQAKSFETEVHNYYKNQQSKDPTDEEKEAFRGKIDNYIANLDAFDKQIIQKAKESIDKIPNISPVGSQTEYPNEVENFYKFDDSGILTCTIVDNILPGIKNETESIIGTTISFVDYAPPSATENNPDSITGDCYDAGIDSMAWILCPVINNMTQTVDGIDGLLKSWLQIDTNAVFKDQTYTAWEVFRNIANIVLIIVFLVVIFSQLTGVGIDNYGIKKLLPRLIVMSILINLSYIICELAVDISNILGTGLDGLFTSVGTAIRGNDGTGWETVGTIVDGLFGALAGAGAIGGIVVTAIGSAGGGAMLVVSLLLVLIVALVSVFMFFVMLGARMIIVIVFAVIAPVAFALYILPNTQSLFKKWWRISQAALVVFPICGALYGASFIIKAIIFGGGEVNFLWALIAICAPFLPFLLLPTLLKGTLSGLGALGGTLTMLGSGLKKGFSRGSDALRGASGYKERAEIAKENAALARANRIHNRLNRRRDRAGLNERQQERLRRAKDIIRAHEDRSEENKMRTKDNTYYDAMRQKRVFDAEAEEKNILRYNDQDYLNAMRQKRDLEAKSEAEAISRYKSPEYLAAREQGIKDEAANRRIADQQALIMAGLEYDDGNKKVNANDLRSVSDYHKYLLRQIADPNKSKEERATNMEKVKAVQNILSGTDKGRGYVQQNIEDAIRHDETIGLSEAASHLFVNYGDKYKAANRGAHAMLSDLAIGRTDDSGDLVDANSRKIKGKLDEYSMAGTDKYTAESLASADEEAIKRLVDAYSRGRLGSVADQTSEAYKIASTAYSAMNNPNISTKLKPEVGDELKKLIVGYTPSVTPEAAMIDAQYQNFQVNYQLYAQRAGRDPHTNMYPVPNGFKQTTPGSHIYEDSNGHTYDAKNNTFS